MNKNLTLAIRLVNYMLEDRKETCSFRDQIIFPTQLTPVESRAFFGCIGWTLMFKRKEDRLLVP